MNQIHTDLNTCDPNCVRALTKTLMEQENIQSWLSAQATSIAEHYDKDRIRHIFSKPGAEDKIHAAHKQARQKLDWPILYAAIKDAYAINAMTTPASNADISHISHIASMLLIMRKTDIPGLRDLAALSVNKDHNSSLGQVYVSAVQYLVNAFGFENVRVFMANPPTLQRTTTLDAILRHERPHEQQEQLTPSLERALQEACSLLLDFKREANRFMSVQCNELEEIVEASHSRTQVMYTRLKDGTTKAANYATQKTRDLGRVLEPHHDQNAHTGPNAASQEDNAAHATGVDAHPGHDQMNGNAHGGGTLRAFWGSLKNYGTQGWSTLRNPFS